MPLHIGSFGREAETEAFLSYIAHEQPHAVMLASVLSFLHRAAAQTCASEAREGRERDRQRERETERERDREREREREREKERKRERERERRREREGGREAGRQGVVC